MKQLSRDPNAAEKARRAEKKADAEAGLRVLDTGKLGPASSIGSSGGGGGFKKGGFKSSFTTVKGPIAPGAPTKKNVLGDDDDGRDDTSATKEASDTAHLKSGDSPSTLQEQGESDTDEEYMTDTVGGRYYDPRRPTDCFTECIGINHAQVQAANA